MTPLHLLSLPLALLMVSQSLLSVSRLAADPPVECKMILIVESDVIIAWDCQGGNTECETFDPDRHCHELTSGVEGEPHYKCQCCKLPPPPGAEYDCMGVDDNCVAIVKVPEGQAPYVWCATISCSGDTDCNYVLTPVSGAASCPCR